MFDIYINISRTEKHWIATCKNEYIGELFAEVLLRYIENKEWTVSVEQKEDNNNEVE